MDIEEKRKKGREKSSKWRKKHPELHKERNRNWWNLHGKELMKKKKMEVFIHYSGNPPKCSCCGESEIGFLSIDHINGGGNKHRKSLGNSGHHIYRWLIKNNFPLGFQVLCYNCNLAKGFLGECPHKSNQSTRTE